MKRFLLLLLAFFATFAVLVPHARAQLWDEQIGDVVLDGNDDGSVGPIDLPFPVKVYGNTYTRFWANNNGDVTFTGDLSEYTSFAFPNSRGAVIVAPFFADVDTRPGASGKVHYSVKEDRFVVTWDKVGYYGGDTDKLNRFQVIFTRDFLVGFSYDTMEWTTGDASGGSGGFGGEKATAGFDSGDGVRAHVLWKGNADADLDFLRHRTFWFDLSTGDVLTDAYPPETTILTGPGEGSLVKDKPVRFTYTGLDDVTKTDRLVYQWQFNDGECADGGRVKLLQIDELEPNYDPALDPRPTLWEAVHHLAKRRQEKGVAEAGALLRRYRDAQTKVNVDRVRDLAYRLYAICDAKRWAAEARPYNALASEWLQIEDASQEDAAAWGSVSGETNLFSQ